MIQVYKGLKIFLLSIIWELSPPQVEGSSQFVNLKLKLQDIFIIIFDVLI
ncbi:hypothetical protein LLB_0473 [Legionella longbeachae D-4968]|nr:hypothetical protein LLB_0473 [Legionella longbeachae D-4968]